MTGDVVTTKQKSVEKMKETVMMIASAKMVLFVAQIIAPLEVEVILVLDLIVAQKCQVFLCYFNVLDSCTGLLI